MTTKRQIDTVCKKCGEIYDSNYKSCPNCGFNPFRNTLKIIGISFLSITIVVSLVLTIINTVMINELGQSISELKSVITSGSDSSQQGADLTKYTFYDEYVLYENAVLDNLGDDYLLYFHQEDCSACQTSNTYVLSYYNIPVAQDSDEYIFDKKPVYFITPDTNNALFEQFNVESTPTMIRMSGSKEVKRAEGVDEVNDLFGEIVKEYYPE